MAAEKQSWYPADRKAATNGHQGQTNGANEKKALHTEQPAPRQSFLHRHAFIMTVVITTMLDGLGFSVVTQFRYRYFRSVHQDELSQFNSTLGGQCGTGELDPEVQVGLKACQTKTRHFMKLRS